MITRTITTTVTGTQVTVTSQFHADYASQCVERYILRPCGKTMTREVTQYRGKEAFRQRSFSFNPNVYQDDRSNALNFYEQITEDRFTELNSGVDYTVREVAALFRNIKKQMRVA